MASDIIARGMAAGKADLVGGKVPASQLPGYVDDVVEYPSKDQFPNPGETGKIYVDLASGYTYRWSGHAYVAVGVTQLDDLFGIVVVSGSADTGTLNADEVAEISKSAAVIVRGAETFLKTAAVENGFIFNSAALGYRANSLENTEVVEETNAVGDEESISVHKIAVNIANGTWAYTEA